MSTLPKLPNILRKVGVTSTAAKGNQSSTSNLPQTSSPLSNPLPTIQTPSPPANQPLPKTGPSAAQIQSQNVQIQNLRETTLRKYEQYVSQLRQLDRNFSLNMKKIEQANSRAITRVVDSVSSLASEIQQLKNQSTLLQRKLRNISKMQEQTQKDGITRAIKPLSDGFTAFETEFDKAQSNVDKLFFGLETRTGNLLDSYKAISPITKTVKDFQARLAELTQSHQNTVDTLNISKAEIRELLDQQRNHVLQTINDKTAALSGRIAILEQRAAKALDQSQGVISDSQTAQFEMRKVFDQSLDNSMKSYKQRLDEVRGLITDLAQTRFNQIDDLRNRLATASEELSKAKHKNMKQMIETKTVARTSLRPEIDRLKAKCEELEKILEEKGKLNNKPREVRMYHMVQEDGTIKYINVLADGTVVV
ncbi:hypothetical protein TVAG_489840 [Trichomonas vaginalis G3]|uniref:Uncharacterized protein n=1 Tax=Trichomonas vaginalis (strain ATCC PRA-98 / G3) TaxID=412133 RepID=A2FQ73_TRIV3|nr:hypothetical protein TVAGG3_0238730 [Trichomonas vaginalis G3]EAX92945.1 hypothetical protein TVAG_489840 [Trichomonas vaginalis G3]KAI5553165.1 hypothetical protein TVAGG3_0238730 [Trichomonas vaginalis G3]|eukprot:XP_001305875.1 hypothetical protein [Trichomonas vaginalis G3]